MFCGKKKITSQDCDRRRDHSRAAPQQKVPEKYHIFSLMYSALPDSALLTGFDPHRLRCKEQPEDLSEDHFFHQKSDCDRKDQAGDHCHEGDEWLHMSSPFVLRIESGNPLPRAHVIV